MEAIVATDAGMIARDKLRIELAPVVFGDHVLINVDYYSGDKLVRRSALARIDLMRRSESENSINVQLDYHEAGNHVRSTVIADVFRGFSVNGEQARI